MLSGASRADVLRALLFSSRLRACERYDCFSCGKPMMMTSIATGWCDACEVAESREAWFSRVLTCTSFTEPDGTVVSYDDHAAGYYPHP